MPFALLDSSREMIERHFKRKKLVWDEPYFLQVLNASESKYDVYFAVLALRDCGTSKAIPALKDKLFYPMQDVKCCSILTIAQISGAEQTPLFAEMLSNPEYKEKFYAMWAINDAADSRAIESVLAYFKKNRSKLKNGKLLNGTLVFGLEYLQKFQSGNESITTFFNEVKDYFGKLPEGDRIGIPKRVSFFSSLTNFA